MPTVGPFAILHPSKLYSEGTDSPGRKLWMNQESKCPDDEAPGDEVSSLQDRIRMSHPSFSATFSRSLLRQIRVWSKEAQARIDVIAQQIKCISADHFIS